MQELKSKQIFIDSKLDPMLAISDGEALVLLEFLGRKGLEREIEKLRLRTQAVITPGEDAITAKIATELAEYFAGTLKEFKTPFKVLGSEFQKSVWNALQQIPYGTTLSYEALAEKIGRPNSCRAVANANGANQLALIIPCHRVIQKNGALGGYGGGVATKLWLLKLESAQK